MGVNKLVMRKVKNKNVSYIALVSFLIILNKKLN